MESANVKFRTETEHKYVYVIRTKYCLHVNSEKHSDLRNIFKRPSAGYLTKL
jgi:hypothetical protein